MERLVTLEEFHVIVMLEARRHALRRNEEWRSGR